MLRQWGYRDIWKSTCNLLAEVPAGSRINFEGLTFASKAILRKKDLWLLRSAAFIYTFHWITPTCWKKLIIPLSICLIAIRCSCAERGLWWRWRHAPCACQVSRNTLFRHGEWWSGRTRRSWAADLSSQLSDAACRLMASSSLHPSAATWRRLTRQCCVVRRTPSSRVVFRTHWLVSAARHADTQWSGADDLNGLTSGAGNYS